MIAGQALPNAPSNSTRRQFPNLTQRTRGRIGSVAGRFACRLAKSASFEIRIQFLSAAMRQISASEAWLNPSSATCEATQPDCPAIHRASAGGSWLSTRKVTPREARRGRSAAPRIRLQPERLPSGGKDNPRESRQYSHRRRAVPARRSRGFAFRECRAARRIGRD